MGFFDDLKYKREAKQEYKANVDKVLADVARADKAMKEEGLKYSKLVEMQQTGIMDAGYFRNWNPQYTSQLQTNPQMMQMAIEEARQKMMYWENSKKKAEQSLLYMRPQSQKDAQERQDVLANFAKNVESVDPTDSLNLRFHATSLATAKDIIQSGGLISSVDRNNGFIESTNLSNEISVSSIHNIQYSVDFWMDTQSLSESKPCGVMFVVQPQSQEEADMIVNRQMHNVLFKQNPEQLVAIVTTSENIPTVQKWLEDNGIRTDCLHTFDEFPKALEQQRNSLNPTYPQHTQQYNQEESIADKILENENVINNEIDEQNQEQSLSDKPKDENDISL